MIIQCDKLLSLTNVSNMIYIVNSTKHSLFKILFCTHPWCYYSADYVSTTNITLHQSFSFFGFDEWYNTKMSIVLKSRRFLVSGSYCRLLSLLFFSQFVFPILCNRTRSRSPRWHQKICKFTQSLLYVPEKQLAFKGQFTPMSSNPSHRQLQQYNLITRCLVYPQYIRTSLLDSFVNNAGDASRPNLLDPIVLSQSDAHVACLFGCVRILYGITVPESSEEIYVLIVTKRESKTCQKQTTFLVSNVNRNQYAVRKYNTMNSHSYPPRIYDDSRGRRYRAEWKWSSRQQLDLKNLKLRNHCIPRQSAFTTSSEVELKSPSVKPYNQLLCSKILEAVSNRTRNNNLSVNAILHVSTTPVVELFDVTSTSPSPTVQCLLPWKSNRLISQPVFAKTNLQCVFGCSRRYFQYQPTGEIAEFFFVRNCEPLIFRPCSTSSSSCCFAQTSYSTTSASRLPVSAIMNVSSPSDDRAKVVWRAITELRKRPGFNSLASSNIVETRVEKRSGSWYKVIIWLELSVAEF